MKYFQLTSSDLGQKSDTWGALASFLCVIHCVATPFIFVVQASSAHHSAAGPSWWGMIDYLFLAVSLVAVYFSAKDTTLSWIPTALYASWGILAFFIINERFHFLHASHALVYLPAASLILLHLYNRKYCRCEVDHSFSVK